MAMVEGLAGVCHVSQRGETAKQTGVDGSRSLAVDLLIDDGFGEGLKRALFGGDSHSEGAGAGDEFAELRVRGGELGESCGGVVGWGLSAGGVRAGHGKDDTANDFFGVMMPAMQRKFSPQKGFSVDNRG